MIDKCYAENILIKENAICESKHRLSTERVSAECEAMLG